MSTWRKEFTHYPEHILDGSKWIGRIYNYDGPAKVVETQTGIAATAAEAREEAHAWSTAALEKYRRT